MDTLTLRKYSRSEYLGAALAGGQSTHGKANGRDAFVEFFVNEVPLSNLIDVGNKEKMSILENWTGVLGAFNSPGAEMIKVKQLLNKKLTAKDIRNALPPDLSQDEIGWHEDQLRDELADPRIIIYCCAECGDFDCGGVRITIDKNETSVFWTLLEMPIELRFEFDKHQYYAVFERYLDSLGHKSH
jgi:hypothetical protein